MGEITLQTWVCAHKSLKSLKHNNKTNLDTWYLQDTDTENVENVVYIRFFNKGGITEPLKFVCVLCTQSKESLRTVEPP